MQRTLQTLVHCCHGDDRPDCPILDDLAAPGTVRAARNLSCGHAHHARSFTNGCLSLKVSG
jgi:hypothetical protein